MNTLCLRISCIVMLIVSLSAQAQFSTVISLGDSLSDTGNVADLTLGIEPPSPYFFGRFSNGQVWNELLAIELGLSPPTPSRNGGDNYAHGGALTSMDEQIVIIPIFFVITLPSSTSQIFDFLSDVGHVADNNALYTLTIGGNDILAAGDALSAAATMAEIDAAKLDLHNVALSLQVALQQLLNDLPAGGAARIVMLNVPNVGSTPRAIAEGKQTIYQELTEAYNGGLHAVVSGIADQRLLLVDFFALTNDAVANPQRYGFTNVTDRCWQEVGDTICSNPDEYLFWDDIHPTSMGHTMMMLQVMDALFPDPEPVDVPIHPAAVWLLLLLLAGGARHRFKTGT